MQKYLTSIFLILLSAPGFVSAQTAFRCDEGGKTVYSEKPCVTGAASQAIVSTQDSDSQRLQTEKANAQMRADNAALNRDIQARNQSTNKRSSAPRQKATADKKPKKVKTKKETSKIKIAKTKTTKPPKKADNRMLKSS
jgi:hypothetical protein